MFLTLILISATALAEKSYRELEILLKNLPATDSAVQELHENILSRPDYVVFRPLELPTSAHAMVRNWLEQHPEVLEQDRVYQRVLGVQASQLLEASKQAGTEKLLDLEARFPFTSANAHSRLHRGTTAMDRGQWDEARGIYESLANDKFALSFLKNREGLYARLVYLNTLLGDGAASKRYREAINSTSKEITLGGAKTTLDKWLRAVALEWVEIAKGSDIQAATRAMRHLDEVPALVREELKDLAKSGTQEIRDLARSIIKEQPASSTSEWVGAKLLEFVAKSDPAADLCREASRFKSFMTKKDRAELAQIENRLNQISEPLVKELTEEQSSSIAKEVEDLFERRFKILDSVIDRFQNAKDPGEKKSFALMEFVSHSMSSTGIKGIGFQRQNISFTQGKRNFEIVLHHSNTFAQSDPVPGWFLIGTISNHIDQPYRPSPVMNKLHLSIDRGTTVMVPTKFLFSDKSPTFHYVLPDGTSAIEPKEIQKWLEEHSQLPAAVPVRVGVSFSPNEDRCYMDVNFPEANTGGDKNSIPSLVGDAWMRLVVRDLPMSSPSTSTGSAVTLPMPQIDPAPVEKPALVLSPTRMLWSPTKPWTWFEKNHH
jgi:hypothetical protein